MYVFSKLLKDLLQKLIRPRLMMQYFQWVDFKKHLSLP